MPLVMIINHLISLAMVTKKVMVKTTIIRIMLRVRVRIVTVKATNHSRLLLQMLMKRLKVAEKLQAKKLSRKLLKRYMMLN